ncbi:YncE family protein [Mycobacterium sp.]|uniref:YncE family protein n=1 Tax=Mycobacterium sp. TaxID=1785 RepID=UPI003D6A9E86
MLLVLTLVTGCGSKPLDDSPPTIQPAHPAESPPVSSPPAGVVRPLGGHPRAAIFDSRTAALAVLVPGPDPAAPASLAVLGADQNPPRSIELPGPATALTGDGAGTVFLSTRGGYFAVDLSAGRVARVDIGEAQNVEFTAIARRADATMVLGTADGMVYTPASGTAANRTKIYARVDSLVAQGNTVAVLDRAQTSVTTIGADGTLGQALRAGQGATTMATDPLGRVLVIDTRGGQLLVFGVDPLILRQAYPVRQAPYGLAGSKRLTWVSQTAANLVIGYDLDTGIPVEKVRYPTVRQPNSLAVDDTSDTLYVVSGSGAGVQVIEHAAGPR